MNHYRLDHIDHLGNLHLGAIHDFDSDQEAKNVFKPLAGYWKKHGHKVIILKVLDSGVCITI